MTSSKDGVVNVRDRRRRSSSCSCTRQDDVMSGMRRDKRNDGSPTRDSVILASLLRKPSETPHRRSHRSKQIRSVSFLQLHPALSLICQFVTTWKQRRSIYLGYQSMSRNRLEKLRIAYVLRTSSTLDIFGRLHIYSICKNCGRYRLRSAGSVDYVLLRTRGKHAQRSFCCSGPVVWNGPSFDLQGGPKIGAIVCTPKLHQILTDFRNYFTVRITRKFAYGNEVEREWGKIMVMEKKGNQNTVPAHLYSEV